MTEASDEMIVCGRILNLSSLLDNNLRSGRTMLSLRLLSFLVSAILLARLGIQSVLNKYLSNERTSGPGLRVVKTMGSEARV